MQRKSVLVLVLCLLAGIPAAIVLASGSGGDPLDPSSAWSADASIDDPDAPAPDSAAIDPLRTEVAGEGAAGPGDARMVEVALRGRVVDRGRAPVASAKVYLSFSGGRFGGRGGRGGRGGGGRGGAQEPVITDQSGVFRYLGQAVPNARLNLRIAHDDYAPHRSDRELGDAETVTDLGNIEILVGGVLRGRVTDVGGNGLPGATVTAALESGNGGGGQGGQGGPGGRGGPGGVGDPIEVDRAGAFEIRHLTPGEYRVRAEAPQHQRGGSRPLEVEDELVADVGDIELGPGFQISGTVFSADGAPVARARVQARAGGRGGGDFGERTDERGEFMIDHLPNNPLQLTVEAEGYLTHSEGGIQPMSAPALVIRLRDGLRIEGVVVDARTSEPVTRYGISANRVGDLPDPERDRQLAALAQDRERLVQSFRDLRSQAGGNQAAAREQMGALFAKMQELETQVAARGGDVTEFGGFGGFGRGGRGGRGGDQGGQNGQRGDQGGGRGQRGGAEGGRGDAFARTRGGRDAGGGGDQQGGGRRRGGRTEEHDGGRFVLAGLQEGIYVVDVRSSDHLSLRSERLELRAGVPVPEQTLAIERGFVVRGVVADADGTPIPGADVSIMQMIEPDPARQADGGDGRGRGRGGPLGELVSRLRESTGPRGRPVARARADEQGRFEANAVPAGTFFASARADGHAGGQTGTFAVAQDVDNVRVELGAFAGLHGRVLGIPSGRERDVRVVVASGTPGGGRRGGGGQRSVRVDEKGEYHVDDLDAGGYFVRAYLGSAREMMRQQLGQLGQLAEGATLDFDVKLDQGVDQQLDLQLINALLGVVQGVVIHNGEPAKGFRVSLQPAPADGSAAVAGGGGGGGGRGNRGGRGGAQGGAGGFGAMFAGLGGGADTSVDSLGRFKFDDVSPGDYDLVVRASQRGRQTLHRERIRVVPEANTLQVSISSGRIEGKVLPEPGLELESLRGAVVLMPGVTELPAEGGGRWFGRGGNTTMMRLRDGAFESDFVPMGPALLVLNVAGRAPATQQVVVGAGTLRIDVRVGAPAQNGEGGARGFGFGRRGGGAQGGDPQGGAGGRRGGGNGGGAAGGRRGGAGGNGNGGNGPGRRGG